MDAVMTEDDPPWLLFDEEATFVGSPRLTFTDFVLQEEFGNIDGAFWACCC